MYPVVILYKIKYILITNFLKVAAMGYTYFVM